MNEALSHSSTEPLLDHLAKSFRLTEEEKELVRAKFHSRFYRKRQFVLQEGDVCTQFNFIVRAVFDRIKLTKKVTSIFCNLQQKITGLMI